VDKISNSGEKIMWSSWEYEHKEQSTDWFWALGVIVVAGSLASIIFGNFFFAIVLVLGGGMLAYFAKHKPGITHYELNDKGLMVKNRLYPYQEIKSFFVQTGEKNGVVLKPTLFIRSSRMFIPIIPIPIEPYHSERIKAKFLSEKVEEEKMETHSSEKIMDFLGF
jgi:hypothetical protein